LKVSHFLLNTQVNTQFLTGKERKVVLETPIKDSIGVTCFYKEDLLLGSQKLKCHEAGSWWLMPIILVTWEAEIRRIVV
jgi:hypothetical protein